MSAGPVCSGARLDGRMEETCRRHAGAPAVTDAAGTLSYGAFADVVARLSDDARAAGLMGDEPVVVAVSNHARDLAAIVSAWKAGGVAVPLHRSATAETVADVLARTGARFLINTCPHEALGGLGRSGAAVERLHDAPPPPRDVLSGAAWIVFTSGSTGAPKGVVHAHDRYLAKLDAINAAMALPAPQRVLMPLQLTFAYAHWVCLTTLLRGGEVVLASPFRPDRFLRALRRGVTAAAVVPTMLRRLRPLIGRGGGQYSGVLISGGEPLPADLGRFLRGQWPEAKLWDAYGLTETATSDFYVRPENYDAAAGTIGRPAPGVAFRIAPDSGELQIRTPFLMRGYLDAPELTAEALNADYFRTGDQARLRRDGFVEITGRLKDLVNRSGNKIAPLEIERAFLAHPDVEQALAAGLPDADRGESLHLLVVPRQGAALAADALRAWAEDHMERYKIPDAIHVASEIPTGQTGKADRNALRTLIAAGRLTEVDPMRISER